MIKYFLAPIILLLLLTACEHESATDKIVIVDVQDYGREDIAWQIQNINSFNPKVIAIDVFFLGRTDRYRDSYLKSVLDSSNNLVLGSRIRNYTYEDINYSDTVETDPYFLSNARTGFLNAVLEYDEYQTLKRFSIKETVNGKTEYHFAIMAAMLYDSIKTMNYIAGKKKIIDVDYQKDQSKFKIIGAREALEKSFTREEIEGKIVLFGTYSLFEEDPDIFYSPLRDTTISRGPDMWGVQYLANIIAQVLE